MKILDYYRPESLEGAAQLLVNEQVKVIGGGLWLKLAHNKADNVLDLSGLGLDYIENHEDFFIIGAMASLHSIESTQGIISYADGILSQTIALIRGVQFRNIATLGGSVAGRFGFSDVMTSLLALDAELIWYKRGTQSLGAYLEEKLPGKDILLAVKIPKTCQRAVFFCMKPTALSFSLINTAVVLTDSEIHISVGARPGRSKLIRLALNEVQMAIHNKELQKVIGDKIDETWFGTNREATAAYRYHLCQVYIDRGIKAVME